jgi:DNA-binding NarL/FixJ family response regulator
VAPLRAPIVPDPDSERFEAELVARVAATQQRARAIQAHMAGAASAPDRAAAPASAVTPTAIRTPAATPASIASPTREAAPPAAAPMMTDRQIQAMWGAAMADVAAEYTADLATLSPEARRDAMVRAKALNACASDLISGHVPPRPRPGDLGAIMR